MMHRDLSPAFNIDPDAVATVRDYIEGEFDALMLEDWCRHLTEVTKSLSVGWRCRLGVKVVTDRRGREQRFPVLLVENEYLP